MTTLFSIGVTNALIATLWRSQSGVSLAFGGNRRWRNFYGFWCL